MHLDLLPCPFAALSGKHDKKGSDLCTRNKKTEPENEKWKHSIPANMCVWIQLGALIYDKIQLEAVVGIRATSLLELCTHQVKTY
ncbi:MAG: hypothetical protein H0W73_04940 [Bacteroidetes bacterium]|nr:hypothetical protein [Bacteroidota bacterium]